MHMVIRAIVYAKDKEEALENAEHIFGKLVGTSRPFDYYTMFRDGDDKYGVSGRSRWKDIPAVAKATSKEGTSLIENGMKYTVDAFNGALDQIKGYIRDDDTENSMFRYYCYVIGQYEGPDVFLYDQDGEGIRDRKHLENVLNKWAGASISSSKEYEKLKIFVVPADVHS